MKLNELNYMLIKDRLNNNKFILYSDNEFSIKNTLNLFKKNIKSPELNILNLDIEKIKENNNIVIDLLETVPFLGDKRLLIIQLDSLGEDTNEDKEILATLKKYLPSMPSFALLVIYFFKKDKRQKMPNKKVKALVKSGADFISIQSSIIECKRMVTDFCRNNNLKLSSDVYSYITSEAINLDLLNNDLNKLLFIDQNKITIDYIKNIFSFIAEDDNLDFINAIGKKDSKDSIRIFNELIDKGIQPINIIFSLEKNFQKILYCYSELKEEKSSSEIAKKYNFHPYYAKKLCDSAKNYSLNRIGFCLEQCSILKNKIMNIQNLNIQTSFEIFLVNLLK